MWVWVGTDMMPLNLVSKSFSVDNLQIWKVISILQMKNKCKR